MLEAMQDTAIIFMRKWKLNLMKFHSIGRLNKKSWQALNLALGKRLHEDNTSLTTTG